MFAAGCWFLNRCYNHSELKGNTGVKSGAVPATVIHKQNLLIIMATGVRFAPREGISKVESQETCLHQFRSKLSG